MAGANDELRARVLIEMNKVPRAEWVVAMNDKTLRRVMRDGARLVAAAKAELASRAKGAA